MNKISSSWISVISNILFFLYSTIFSIYGLSSLSHYYSFFHFSSGLLIFLPILLYSFLYSCTKAQCFKYMKALILLTVHFHCRYLKTTLKTPLRLFSCIFLCLSCIPHSISPLIFTPPFLHHPEVFSPPFRLICFLLFSIFSSFLHVPLALYKFFFLCVSTFTSPSFSISPALFLQLHLPLTVSLMSFLQRPYFPSSPYLSLLWLASG